MVGCVCAWDHGKGRDWREVTGSNRGRATTEGVAQVIQVREEGDEELERHSGDTGALSWVWGICKDEETLTMSVRFLAQ
uniref:Uncharacterized protein n=1 Tax=Ailuropoda melanoleuca TaxID=9646 RepID=A0A7N5JP37_AILME